jgi:hypothetical protein
MMSQHPAENRDNAKEKDKHVALCQASLDDTESPAQQSHHPGAGVDAPIDDSDVDTFPQQLF